MQKVKNIVFYDEDEDILKYLETKSNFHRFIKMLIRNHIEKERYKKANDI
jgi:hypothetical protein